jgi:PKD repeat protein
MASLGASLGSSLSVAVESEVDPPVAAAGADDSFDMLSAAPYQLAGSATGGGTITYLWSASGPVGGTATFADATSPTSTVTVDKHGTWTFTLTATNASGSDDDSMTLTVTASAAALFTRMASGSRVNFGIEVDVSTETLVDDSGTSRYSQINDLGTGAKHLTQGTMGNRPRKNTGGPNAKNRLHIDSAVRNIVNAAMGIATGKRLEIYEVSALPGGASLLVTSSANTSDDAHSVQATYQQTSKCKAGAWDGTTDQALIINTPALNTNWTKRVTRYRAAGCDCLYNGSAVSPDLSGTATAGAVGIVRLGHASVGGGSVYLYFVFENVSTVAGSACLSEEGAIDYYLNKQAGPF